MEKLNILLSCSYGLSTSILVKKMERYFDEQKYPFTVEAQPESIALENIKKFDVVLIGPQVRYLKPKFDNVIGGEIPVYVMESRPYGMQQVDTLIETMLDEMRDGGFYE